MTQLAGGESGSGLEPGDFAWAERVTVAEKVARNLLGLIRSGSIGPGEQLPAERDIAAMLGVSRPSVREALRGLQILGVVRTRQGGGVYVTSLKLAELLQPLQMLIGLTRENFEALHESRIIIEGAIGRLLPERINAETLAHLHSIVAVQETLVGDPVAFRLSDTEFHQSLRSAIGNPFLERISEALYLLGMEYRRTAWETPEVLTRSVADHRAIVTALEAGDVSALEAAMQRHMHSVHETTKAAMLQSERAGRKA